MTLQISKGGEFDEQGMSPEIKLVDEYNKWYFGQLLSGDLEKLRAGLPNYITNETVLHEAVCLPWGGPMVGYDGWVRHVQIARPVWEKIWPVWDVSKSAYYRHGNLVFHEVTLTIKATKEAPEPFVMGVIEKYTIENGRIKQIDEFYADTATLLKRFHALNAIPGNQ